MELEHEDWAAYVAQVKRPNPVGGEVLGDGGYLNCLCTMGLYGDGDHYAIEPFGVGGVKMSFWYDDADDMDALGPNGIVWTFEPMREIVAKGGMWQPRLTRTVIGTPERLAIVKSHEAPEGRSPPITCSLDVTQYIEWASWAPPPEELTLHGIWMSKGLHDVHQTVRSHRGWREWTDGLAPELCEIVDGRPRLKQQRPMGKFVRPDGTITWFLLDADVATGVHAAQLTSNENGMDQTDPASAIGEVSGNYSDGEENIAYVFSSPSGEPGTATWPTGNYRCQFDVSATGANMVYGLLSITALAGHMARVNTGLTADGTTNAQAEGVFSGIANHLATTGSVSWGTPATTDRWECCIDAERTATGGHGNQSFTVDLDQADSFTDGPWAVGADLVEVIAETENINEGSVRAMALTRVQTETESVSEGFIPALTLARTLSETEGISEFSEYTRRRLREIAENEDISEGITRTIQLNRLIAETVDISEALARSRALTRLIAETENIQDAEVRVRSLIRIVSETVEINEGVVSTLLIGADLVEVISETMNVSEAVTAARALNRILAETIEISEVFSGVKDMARIIAETENISETNAGTLQLARIVTETGEISEALAQAQNLARIAAETVEISEAITRPRTLARIVSETAQITEATVSTLIIVAAAVIDFLKGSFSIAAAAAVTRFSANPSMSGKPRVRS